jgi:hypothetical protein
LADLQNTLYHNQKLIDLLNMAAGDQAYVKTSGDGGVLLNSRRWIRQWSINSKIMKNEFKGSKKSEHSQYSNNDAPPNIVLLSFV